MCRSFLQIGGEDEGKSGCVAKSYEGRVESRGWNACRRGLMGGVAVGTGGW